MREIKFRAWGSRDKKMHYFDMVDIQNNMGFDYGLTDNLRTLYSETEDFDCNKFMQYTGLKDKNGKEIYEGDIVKTHSKILQNELAEVIFEKQMFALSWINDREALFEWIREHHNLNSELEIIGNIYENPELLKGE